MVLGGLLYIVFFILKGKELSLFKNIISFALFIYAGALVSLCFTFVLPSNWHFTNTKYVLENINLTPFESSYQIYLNCKSTGNFHAFYYLIIGNFAMLMPLGILISLINHKIKGLKVLILGFFASVFIEISQLISNLAYGTTLRAVELDDVILNTAGCFLAYLIYALFRKLYHHINKKEL